MTGGGGGSGSGGIGAITADDDSGNKDSEGGGDDEKSSKPGSGTTGGNTSGAGDGGNTQVYDDSGYTKKIPQVNRIAAVGQYALITQMLGGKGTLVAADADFLSTVKSSKAFEGEGISNIKVGWSGDGTAAGSADIDAIVKSGADCVLLERNTDMLSTSQVSALKEKGISTIYMPHLGEIDTSDEDVVKAVNVVGQALKDATGKKSSQRATDYENLHDKALDETASANGGWSYMCRSGREYPYKYQGTVTVGTGVATKVASAATCFVDTMASANESTMLAEQSWSGFDGPLDGKTLDITCGLACSAKVSGCYSGKNGIAGRFALMSYYLQAAGVMDTSYSYTNPNDKRYHIILAGAYEFMDYFDTSDVSKRQGWGIDGSLWFTRGTSVSHASDWTTVGDDYMPGIIVRNDSIADALYTSSKKANGYYNSGNKYKIWVMPSSLAGSWADGNVESCFIAPYFYGLIQDDGDMSAVRSYLDDYYEEFYRCSFSQAKSSFLHDYGEVRSAGRTTFE